MLHVRTRRRLAVIIVLASLGLSVLAARIVRDRYSAKAVHAAAERAISQLLEAEVELGALGFLDERKPYFEWGSLSENGRKMMSFHEVTIGTRPPPWQRWDIDEVGVSVISLEFDLTTPGEALSHYEEDRASLLRVLERCVPPHHTWSLYDNYGDDMLPPEEEPVIWALVRHGEHLWTHYVQKKRFLDEGVFELIPDPVPARHKWRSTRPEGWSFVIDSEKAVLSSPIDVAGEALAESLVAKGVAHIRGHLDFSDAGTIVAVWDESGETITFERQGGWRVVESAAKALGLDTGPGKLTAQVNSFVIHDDKLMSLSGSLRYEVDAVSTRWLAAWLAAAGVAGLDDGGELPESFRSVFVAADFKIADGEFSVSPPEGAPGLVWAAVNGETIELVTARGSRPLDELLADARKIPADEPPAEEAPAEEPPAEEPPAEEAPAEEAEAKSSEAQTDSETAGDTPEKAPPEEPRESD